MSASIDDVLSGSRAALTIGEEEIGFATDVEGGDSLDWAPIIVLNMLEVAGHAPLGYDASARASQIYLNKNSLRSIGNGAIYPLIGAGGAEFVRNALNVRKDLMVTVVDTPTGTLMFRLERARIAARRWQVRARQIVGEDVEIVGVFMKDHVEDSADKPAA